MKKFEQWLAEATMDGTRAAFEAQLRDIDAQIDRLQKRRDSLHKKMQRLNAIPGKVSGQGDAGGPFPDRQYRVGSANRERGRFSDPRHFDLYQRLKNSQQDVPVPHMSPEELEKAWYAIQQADYAGGADGYDGIHNKWELDSHNRVFRFNHDHDDYDV